MNKKLKRPAKIKLQKSHIKYMNWRQRKAYHNKLNAKIDKYVRLSKQNISNRKLDESVIKGRPSIEIDIFTLRNHIEAFKNIKDLKVKNDAAKLASSTYLKTKKLLNIIEGYSKEEIVRGLANKKFSIYKNHNQLDKDLFATFDYEQIKFYWSLREEFLTGKLAVYEV